MGIMNIISRLKGGADGGGGGLAKNIVRVVSRENQDRLSPYLSHAPLSREKLLAVMGQIYTFRLAIGLYILDDIARGEGGEGGGSGGGGEGNDIMALSNDIAEEFAEFMGWRGGVRNEYRVQLWIELGERTERYRALFLDDLIDYESQRPPYFKRSAEEILISSGLDGDLETMVRALSGYLVNVLPAFIAEMRDVILTKAG